MNAKALIPLVAGLGIAGLAAKLGLDFIRKAEGKQSKVVQLWTPIEDVQRGIAITEPMLKPLEFPAGVVPPGALADVKKIVGRVPHTGAPAGVPILNSMLLPPGARAGVRVPPGLRAVAVKIDESSGVDYHLEPGCRVDVVGVFTVRRTDRTETVARTILENVEVAAVGQRLAPEVPTAEKEKSGNSSRRERPARAVTLLVKPEQVPTLHLAEQKGKIKLSMRGVLDESQGEPSAKVVEDELLGEAEPDPAAVPPPSWRDKFNEFVGSFWETDKPESQADARPVPVQDPEPGAKEEPQLAWYMTVYNGDERRVLGWVDLDDFQAIELSSEGPNLFQDKREFPPPKPNTGSQSGGKAGQKSQVDPPTKAKSESQPEPDSEKDAQPEPEPEPEELFE